MVKKNPHTTETHGASVIAGEHTGRYLMTVFSLYHLQCLWNVCISPLLINVQQPACTESYRTIVSSHKRTKKIRYSVRTDQKPDLLIQITLTCKTSSNSPQAAPSVRHLLNITDNDCTYTTIRTLARWLPWIKNALSMIFTAIMYLWKSWKAGWSILLTRQLIPQGTLGDF